MNNKKRIYRIFICSILSILLCVPMVLLTGCGGRGNSGGLFSSIMQPPVQDQCTNGSKKASSSNILNIGDKWTLPGGTEISIPGDETNFPHHTFTVTYYTDKGLMKDGIDQTWNSTTNQAVIHQQWVDGGKKMDECGLCMIGDRFIIACTTTFGQAGDSVDFKFANGKVLPCIIGDTKNPSDDGCTKWGHNNGCSIVEFELHWNYKENANPGSACHQEWGDVGFIGANCYGQVEIDSGSSKKNNKCELKQTEFDYLVKAQEFANDNSIGYIYSGNMHSTRGKDVDCSHFVYEALAQCNYNVTYAASGGLVSAYSAEFRSEPYNRANIKKGDIVTCGSHCEFVLSVEGDSIQTIGAHDDFDNVQGDGNGKEVCAVPLAENQGYTDLLHPINPHMIGVDSTEQMTEKGQKIVKASETTASPGAGWCAAWVTDVYEAAGYNPVKADANQLLNGLEYSEDMSTIQPGEAIVSEWGTGSLASCGHCGIYIGNGMIRENIGSIVVTPLTQWVQTYGRGWVRHGWLA